MPAYAFINDIISPAFYFLAIGLVCVVALLAVWDFLLETRQTGQEEAQPHKVAQPHEVQQRPEMAQRVRFCPRRDVQEEAGHVAHEAWRKWKVR